MSFLYEKARTLPEAIALYAANGGRMPILAGGTDLVVQWKSGAAKFEGFIDISAVNELKNIKETDDSIEIGALVTHSQIIRSDPIKKNIPALVATCSTVGAAQIQNRGTLGGNIMNASPAGDTLPVVLALDAELLAQSVSSERWINARDFFTGYRKTAISKDEILTKIRFPKKHVDEIQRFYKIGTRRAQAISKVMMCVAGQVSHGGIEKIAISVGSVAQTPMRAYGTEALLKGKRITEALVILAKKSIEDEVTPIDDIRSTADYRRFVCGSLLARFLKVVTSKRG